MSNVRRKGEVMSLHDGGFALLLPEAQHWRESNLMKIPNANLLDDLGGANCLGGRLWRLPPYSANTWHKHVESWEFYFLLEGLGRMRVGENTVTVPRYGCVLVAPQMLRQVFNDTPDDSLWLIVGAPQEGQSGTTVEPSRFYPQDPKSLPPELAGRVWPPT
jgi:mannose-6-phosphate isomerase-like protein (cupin superfamily)